MNDLAAVSTEAVFGAVPRGARRGRSGSAYRFDAERRRLLADPRFAALLGLPPDRLVTGAGHALLRLIAIAPSRC